MIEVLENIIVDDRLIEDYVDKLSDREWRLDNLYWIMDEDGNVVPFNRLEVQMELHGAMWYRNVIPKSRQHGITTYIAILFLDAILFNPNQMAGIIAHRLEDAKRILRNKILFAYNRLPQNVKDLCPITKSNETTMEFANGSCIYVGTSMRSGTLQYLHISEYGKLCARMPLKAQEVKTGTIETVHSGGIIFVESTSEGPFGDFYDICKRAEKNQLSEKELSEMEYKLFFFPWYRKQSNRTDAKYIDVPDEHTEYLDKIERLCNVKLDPDQRAWYSDKKTSLKYDIYKEHPSTLDEAFMASVEGAYYGDEIIQAKEEGRIGKVKFWPDYPVHSVNDLGYGEDMAWLFFQVIGLNVLIIDSYADSRKGMAFYKRMLEQKKEEYGYVYGRHFAPFDIDKGELGTGQTVIKTAKRLGIQFKKLPREKSVKDGIERVTNLFPRLWIDSEKCDRGEHGAIKAFSAYQREWHEQHGVYSDHPLHNWASHYADALRYLSMVIEKKLYDITDETWSEAEIDRLNEQYGRPTYA